MRTLTFTLALAVALIGPSMAGVADAGLPGVGTFAYSGSVVGGDLQPVIVVADR
jgi:hypothetical protein